MPIDTKFWLSVMNNLRNRGVEDILIAVVDGLKGFPDAINAAFPDTQVQTCIVHLVRHSLNFCGWKDRKAVAADPPKGQRVFFPDLPNAQQVIHNEEHLVLETNDAGRYEPGDLLLGIPTHICPTSALHQEVAVVKNGELITPWPVTARNRRLTV